MTAKGKLTDIPGVMQVATPERTDQIEKAVEGTVVMGRPSKYTDDLAEQICEWIASGRSLNRYCQQEGTPGIRTVWSWLDTNEDFQHKYTRAKEDSADTVADEIMDIANDVMDGKLEPNAGRVAGDLKKWTAAKLKPRKYGDKLDVTSDGSALPQPIMAVMGATPVQSTPGTVAPPTNTPALEAAPYKIVDENTIDEIIGDDE